MVSYDKHSMTRINVRGTATSGRTEPTSRQCCTPPYVCVRLAVEDGDGGIDGVVLPAPAPRLSLRMRVPVALNTAFSAVKVQGRFDHTLTHPAHPHRCF